MLVISDEGFEFRHLQDLWERHLIEQDVDRLKHRIRSLIGGHGLLMFLRKGDEVFGGGEPARVVFAQMKNPDADLQDGWADAANFSCINLSKAVRGEEDPMVVFGAKDMDGLKVIPDVDEVIKLLANSAKSGGKPIKGAEPKIQGGGAQLSEE